MKLEQIREEALKIRSKVEQRASLADLHYAACLYYSPISKIICYRVGYFDSVLETEHYIKSLKECYTRLNMKYYVITNIDFLADGGLFDQEELI